MLNGAIFSRMLLSNKLRDLKGNRAAETRQGYVRMINISYARCMRNAWRSFSTGETCQIVLYIFNIFDTQLRTYTQHGIQNKKTLQ